MNESSQEDYLFDFQEKLIVLKLRYIDRYISFQHIEASSLLIKLEYSLLVEVKLND